MLLLPEGPIDCPPLDATIGPVELPSRISHSAVPLKLSLFVIVNATVVCDFCEAAVLGVAVCGCGSVVAEAL